MRNPSPYALVIYVLLLTSAAAAQQTISATTAQALITQSVTVMGGSAPTDSTASGTLQITAGSATNSATFQVRTRGLLQTRETIQAPNGTQDRVYSSGNGSTVAASAVTEVSMEQASSFQSAVFPLPLFQAALSNPDTLFEFVGTEKFAGTPVYHVKLRNSYASQKLSVIGPFSAKDIWLDATTFLPRRISLDSRAARGAVPTVHIDLDFSGFQNFSGVVYPTTVTQYLNSTQWGVFTVQNVVFNTGLTDSDFPAEGAQQ